MRGLAPRGVTGELSPASVYVGLLPVVEACVVVGVRGCVGEVRVAADEAVDLDPGVLALPWEYSSTTTGFSPHPCTKRRLRVLRPCPPPGKRQRRFNAPYAGSHYGLGRVSSGFFLLRATLSCGASLPFFQFLPQIISLVACSSGRRNLRKGTPRFGGYRICQWSGMHPGAETL